MVPILSLVLIWTWITALRACWISSQPFSIRSRRSSVVMAAFEFSSPPGGVGGLFVDQIFQRLTADTEKDAGALADFSFSDLLPVTPPRRSLPTGVCQIGRASCRER